jgi:phosphatidylethanolamine/phosphatidyl-N-methylethanolamine N-methyltransferase
LVCEDLRLAERRTLWPFGLFTMLRFVKQPGYGEPQSHVRQSVSPERTRALVSVSAQRPLPVKARLKWQVGRTIVLSRRLLDTNYWRSLYRRLSSQMAE